MSEKLYALLLRLYPGRFRKAYGDEAVQVLRDRLRDERGFGARARLWLDVLADLGHSLPQEHRRAARADATIPLAGTLGVPTFSALEDEALRPGMFVFGTALALAGLGTFAFLLGHGGTTLQSRMASYSAMQSGVAPAVSGSAVNAVPETQEPGMLDEAERHRVIQAIIGSMNGPWRDASGARAIVQALSMREAAGDYAQIGEGDIFAAALTTQMHAITRDPEVSVYFTPAGTSRMPHGERIDEHFAMIIRQPAQ